MIYSSRRRVSMGSALAKTSSSLSQSTMMFVESFLILIINEMGRCFASTAVNNVTTRVLPHGPLLVRDSVLAS